MKTRKRKLIGLPPPPREEGHSASSSWKQGPLPDKTSLPPTDSVTIRTRTHTLLDLCRTIPSHLTHDEIEASSTFHVTPNVIEVPFCETIPLPLNETEALIETLQLVPPSMTENPPAEIEASSTFHVTTNVIEVPFCETIPLLPNETDALVETLLVPLNITEDPSTETLHLALDTTQLSWIETLPLVPDDLERRCIETPISPTDIEGNQRLLPVEAPNMVSPSTFMPDQTTQTDQSLTSTSDSDFSSDTSSDYEPPSPAESSVGSPQPPAVLDETDHLTNRQQPEIFYGNMNEGQKRKRKAEKESWKKNKNKILRMKGKVYLGYTKPKNEKMKQNKVRMERKLGPRCVSAFCQKSKKRHCQHISEEARQKIFDFFWNNLNWDQRKIYICANVTRTNTIKKTAGNNSRRSGTLQFSLPVDTEDGTALKQCVCRTMFLNTLCIGSFTVQSWIKKSEFGMRPSQENLNTSRSNPVPIVVQNQAATLNDFFDSLPKLPSHYNRKNTSKLFLEPVYRSQAHLYNIYKNHCSENNITPFSIKKFNEEFHEKKLAIHQLKKDMCDTCVGHSVGNINEEEYQAHIQMKERAREEKSRDKEKAEKGECILLTADLQAVKVSPYVTASAIYYKTKLSCHNYTVYDTTNHHSTCYWFTEVATDLTASTYVSLLIDYLTRHCLPKNLPIIVFTDGCGSQNRNIILANALLNFSMRHNVIVTQKFLEVGHTQMECDAVHSAIERKLKNREIHLPSDYVTVSKEARTRPFPYEVLMVEHNFFKDYAEQTTWRYSSLRPGRKTGDPKVNEIKVISYQPAGYIQVKLNFDQEWSNLPSRPRQTPIVNEYKPLHNQKLPITATKFNHLQELKKVIPTDCHAFYDSLPHN